MRGKKAAGPTPAKHDTPVLIKMVRDGQPADVHPDEVENFKAGGWQVVE